MMRSLSRLSLAALLVAALPVAGDEQPPADKALIVVHLPAGATLTIDGAATRQTGAERTFISPSLTPGKVFTYELAATWPEGGQTKTATRKVLVSAGQKSVVDFAGEPKMSTATKRTFVFTYSGAVTGLKPGEKARVWLPVPPTNEDQEVKLQGAGVARRSQGRQGRAVRQCDGLLRGRRRQGRHHPVLAHLSSNAARGQGRREEQPRMMPLSSASCSRTSWCRSRAGRSI